jgi:hypothetical protein
MHFLHLLKFPIYMRTQYLIILHSILPSLLFSQITINQGDMPEDGDTIRTSTSVDIGLINFEETGNNFTWDFSGLIPFSQSVDTFVSVQETPWLYQLVFFLSSNLARKLTEFDQYPGFTVTDTYEYYKNSSSDFRLTGNAATLSGIPLPNKFDSPDILYKFPLTAGNVDSSLSNYEISIPGIGYSGGWKKRVNHADGWGTLITPYGSFQTIRVKSDIIQLDSLYLDTLGIGFPFYRQYTEYKWLGDGFGLPLCTVTDDGLLSTISYIDSVRSIFVGIPEIETETQFFHVFPNPSKGEFIICLNEMLEGPIELTVLDLRGNCLTHKEYYLSHELKLNLNILPPGVYILRVKSNSKLHYQRIIIQ